MTAEKTPDVKVGIPTQSRRDKKNESMFLSVLAVGSQLGFTISFPIAGGVLLGVFLDKKLGTAPSLTLLLLGLGVVVSFITLFRILKEFNK
ncbi:AtpZ/AtpI family protein [Candidatus Gottesmanbacteria bacterium]|nr:AtpZ/AtpI family protein [Candidatus Gottesmanbacteria bacterium]